MRYAEHHCHTHFSALDGVSTADDYIKRAKEIGVEHISITDHQTLAGHSDFQRAGAEHGVSIGLGLEGYFSATDRFDKRGKAKRDDGTDIYNHIGLIAKNENGLKNLQTLNRLAWTEGYYYKPRVDFELLQEYHEDIIVLSGCMSGIVSASLRADDYDSAVEWAKKFKGVFGDDYYMEVMAHNDEQLTKGQFAIADDLGIKTLITSDCHHASPDDLVLQEAMLILSTGPKEAKSWDFSKSQKMDFLERFNYIYPERKMTFEKYDLHLNTGIEQFEKMQAHGYGRTDFVENTIELAEKIGDYPVYKGLDLLPKPKNVDDVDAHLWNKIVEGAKKRGTFGIKEYDDRRLREFNVMKSKGFSTYFIIKQTIDNWARDQKIRIGPGRGSAAGSLVCYELYITDVDPLPHNLLFERFLDEFREDWPDIDTDYQDDRRGEVKAFMKRTFINTGNIMTFTYLEGKNILKDSAKVLKIPFKEVNDVAKRIADWDDYLVNPNAKSFRDKYPEVTDLGNRMRGRLRQVGMHAGGVVVSSKPLADFAAVEAAEDPEDASKDRVEVLALDGDGAAELGLIKYDILGVSALTNIQHTLDLIEERHNKIIDIDHMPLDDPEVYKSIHKKSTLGLFQLEGSAFTKILDKMPIEKFDDLVASTSLIRPGAANSSFGARYLKARNGSDWKPYCEIMRPFTKDTFGEILYQEQLMLTCTLVAGMSTQEANKIRKIIGKKRDVAELQQYEEKFVAGAAENLGGEAKAQKMWNDFKKSADYQFNKSHAVAYSMISYQTAWLKHYYPEEFMLALLRAEKKNQNKVLYFNECKRLGIKIKLPHINKSDAKISIHGDDKETYLRIGLSDVKYVGPAVADKIIKRRPFDSFEQIIEISETKFSGINKRAVEYLDKIGACKFEDHPLRGDERDYYYECLNIPAFDKSELEDYTIELLRTVEEYHDEGTFVVMALVQDITRKNGWARADLFDETGTVGIFFDTNLDIKKGQFYIFLINNNSIVRFMTIDEVKDGSALSKYLTTEKLKPFDGERIIQFTTRTTATGNPAGTLITTDDSKRLHGYTVYNGPQFNKTHTLAMKPGTIVKVEANEKTWKGKTSLVLQDIFA